MNMFLARVFTMLGAKKYDLGAFDWIYDIKDVIDAILWPVIILVAAVGTIYAIVLGVNMARADSNDKREEAKKRVINVLIGMAIIVGLILLLNLFMSLLPKWIGEPVVVE